ncbi:type II CRISPR RNA-guided endonuclease Cas9 [Helicobacter sp. 12S02634-8]|nr:type II CRISPR RNA-guided endonuclease Cas9 [Helicobacter sp. 12S02634-8]
MKILGFDIGITSIGWGLIEVEDGVRKDGQNRDSGKIIDCGVRLFKKAEGDKGASLALPRRNARNVRKIFKRKRARIAQLKNLLAKSLGINAQDFLPQGNHLPKLFTTNKNFLSPWELRALGLERVLGDVEFARVLIHIAKRRGYNDLQMIEPEESEDSQDKEKNEEEKKKKQEEQAMLASIRKNQEYMQNSGYRTIGEMMCKEFYGKEISKGHYQNVRNKGGSEEQEGKKKDKKKNQDKFMCSIGRRELQDEVRILFATQRELGNQKATQALQDEFEKIAFFVREPKGFVVGKCTFFKEENRASKCCYSAEEFINTTSIINLLKKLKNTTGECRFDVSPELIGQILQEAKATKTGLSYKKLRKILELDERVKFQARGLDYTKKDPENKIFIKFEKYHKLKDYLSDFAEEFESLQRDVVDRIANIIASNRSQNILKQELQDLPISEGMREKLVFNPLNFKETINLSLKALGEILPLMLEGKRYDEAIKEAPLDHHSTQDLEKDQEELPALEHTEFANSLNPVVNRAIAQYRKVLKAIIKKHGYIHKIHIEFTREVGKSFEERDKINKQQEQNDKRNQEAQKRCQEMGLEPNKSNLLKVKLWLLQGEFCLYSGEKIKIEHFKDPKLLQIDHIYPLSRSFDDSLGNKVLVFAKQNQDKKNRTVYEWIGDDKDKWDTLYKRICAIKTLPEAVKKKILNTNFKDRNIGDRMGFLERNLNDTAHINRLVVGYTSKYLKFLPLSEDEDMTLKAGSKGSKRHIIVLSGSLTSMLRHYWGLGSKDRDTHLHHAEDALIIAFATPRNIKAFADYMSLREKGYQKAKEEAETLRQSSDYKTKKQLAIPMDKFRDQVNQAVEKIFVSWASRRKVSGALHEATIRKPEAYFKAYGGQEGVNRALKLGKIRSVNGGIVDNGEMVRADIFKSKDEGKYYVVPIYTYDVAVGKLPNKAVVSGKNKENVIKDWLEMDGNYEFCFSLFKDDLIEIQKKEMPHSVYAYYAGIDSSTASLTAKHHSNHLKEEEKGFFKSDKSGAIIGSGIQNLKVFKRYIVFALGEITQAEFEPRKGICLKTTKR